MRHERARAGGDHHCVRPRVGKPLGSGLRVQQHVDAQEVQLLFIVLDQFLQRALERSGSRRGQQAAERVCLFHQRHAVAAEGRNPRRLQTGRSAANHEHSLGLLRLLKCVVALHAGLGVHAAGQGAQRQQPSDTALVAADARAHLVAVPGAHLVRPVRVSDQPAARIDKVGRAAGQDLLGVLWRDVSRDHDGDGHDLLDGPSEFRERGIAKVGRREDVVHGFVAAGVHVQRIHPGRLQTARNVQGVGQAAPALDVMLNRDPEDDREVRPGVAAHGLHDLLGKAQAPGQVAAVLVRAFVPQRREELIDEVARVAVNLDPIGASQEHAPGSVPEILDQGMDLVDGQRSAENRRVEERRHGGRSDGRVARIRDAGLPPHAGRQLHDQPGARVMDGIRQVSHRDDVDIRVGHLQCTGRLEATGDRSGLGDDDPCATLGALCIVVDLAARDVRIGLEQRGAHGRHGDAVARLHPADAAGLEQMAIRLVHATPPPATLPCDRSRECGRASPCEGPAAARTGTVRSLAHPVGSRQPRGSPRDGTAVARLRVRTRARPAPSASPGRAGPGRRETVRQGREWPRGRAV